MGETLASTRRWAATATLSLLVTAFLGSTAHAVFEKEGGKYPWGAIPTNEPDKSTGGWWINLGPTGIRARVKAELAARRSPTYYFARMRTKVKATALDDAGVLHLRGLHMPITFKEKWDSLALGDLKSIALAVLRDGNAGDHAIVAFYLIATDKAKEAEPHLLLAGEAAGVVAAFE